MGDFNNYKFPEVPESFSRKYILLCALCSKTDICKVCKQFKLHIIINVPISGFEEPMKYLITLLNTDFF